VIQAIFFDWFGTLAHYDPPREQLQSQALKELGFEVSAGDLRRSLVESDREFYAESAAVSSRDMTREDRQAMYIRHQERILARAGVPVPADMLPQVISRTRELYRDMRFALFDDVLATLRALKERNLIIGLLTNLRQDIDAICRELGLESYVDFTVTSAEVGAEKPNPPVFLAALERASVTADMAIHVGDQYEVDVAGARRLGIAPVLLDRNNVYPDITDCPRIRSLIEITAYIS